MQFVFLQMYWRNTAKCSTDSDDNIFLDLAFAATADFIVTGKLRDFPTPELQGIRVVSPADYWNFFRDDT